MCRGQDHQPGSSPFGAEHRAARSSAPSGCVRFRWLGLQRSWPRHTDPAPLRGGVLAGFISVLVVECYFHAFAATPINFYLMPPLRTTCPPGACICEREQLLSQPGSDMRVLMLTREEEKRLLERLERLASLEDLRRMQALMYDQLGIAVEVAPGHNEVSTIRGLRIEIKEQVGLCRKTRKNIPAAIRRGLEANLTIVFDLLNEGGLFGGPDDAPGSSL